MPDRGGEPGQSSPPETEEGLEFQRVGWRVQRVGWVLMGLFILLGILGLFGDGPLTRVRTGSPDVFEARYYRVWRLQTEAHVELTAVPESSGRLALRIDDALLRRAEIRFVTPVPRRHGALSGGQLIEFDATGPGPVGLELGITPTRIGRLRTRITSASGADILISVFVLP